MGKKSITHDIVETKAQDHTNQPDRTVKKSIASILDPELNINTKTDLVYYLTFPIDYNPEKRYPLIFSIDGYGGHPTSEYQEKKLRPYLADKYDSIVAGVVYHNINRSGGGTVNFNPAIWDSVFKLTPGEFNEKYVKNKTFETMLDGMFNLLVERNVTRIPSSLSFYNNLSDQYSSFGFLPALEHLQVLHDIISNYPIDSSQINILGTSYGGYIGLLMGKYAPNTFNLIIDNSGFVATQYSEIFPSMVQSSASYMRMIDGIRYEIPVSTQSLWESDEFSERYFSDSHRMIRNLTISSHWKHSKTRYYSYHSVEDTLAPFSQKKFLSEILSSFAHIDLTGIGSKELDGKVFKNLNHGMDASLRRLYDISFNKDKATAHSSDSLTDFHLNSSHIFDCFNKSYQFSYNITEGLTVRVSPTRQQEKQLELRSVNESSKKNIRGTLTLLPADYKNEMFEQNLKYLKEHQTTFYNAVINHNCTEYQLCSNPDGSPNILNMSSNTPLYLSFTMDEILEFTRTNIENTFSHTLVGDSFLGEADEDYKQNSPIQWAMQEKLYKAGPFSELKLTQSFLTPLERYKSDYLPLVRVYGIGLGYHLTEMLRLKNISYMTVYEPNLDLFYTSLFTIPWSVIFKYFSTKGKAINLVIGGTPDTAIESNLFFISKKLMPLTSCFYRYKHFNHQSIAEIISKEPQRDAVERQQIDAGWYEDQRAGFYLSARNIKKRNKFYTGKTISSYSRAFIVGSGPSLDETISYITKHKDDAIIISCGSAMTPLIKAGVIPDYQIVQERTWHFPKHEEKHDLEIVKKISLLKLNVISPKIDHYYKETLVFQKFRDPGSSILGPEYPVTTAVNPTVTNAGIAICAELGMEEIYLFGIDYGAPLEGGKMHAANTIHDEITEDDTVETNTTFDLPGNLGSNIRTTTVLSWSLKTTEQKIKEFPNIKWFNVGEGALITGATPVSLLELPKKFKQQINKKLLREEITSCFDNNYDPNEMIEKIKTTHMQNVEEYFNALLTFSSSAPQTRVEITHVLSLLYSAVSVGYDKTHFLPSSLLSYGFKQFINNVYIQCSIAQDDNSAAHFFDIAKGVLAEYIDDIEKDLLRIIDYIERDSETELIKLWYR